MLFLEAKKPFLEGCFGYFRLEKRTFRNSSEYDNY